MSRPSPRAAAATVAALVIIAVIAVLSAGGGGDSTDPSSRSSGKAGTLALYTWLDRLGFSVTRLSGTFTPDGGDVLFMIEPTTPVSGDDASRVAAFLDSGGEVVLALDAAAAVPTRLLVQRLGVRTGMPLQGGTTAFPSEPFDPSGRLHRVTLGHSAVAVEPSRDQVALLGDRRDVSVAVSQRRAGGGRLYVVGSAFPFSNDGLRAADADALVLALLERARGGRVSFDEVHHGEVSAGADAAIGGPVRIALGIAALVVIVYLGVSGRRPGRAVPSVDPARVPTAGDFVASVAQLMERSRARGAVAQRYAEELKHRVGTLTGIDPALDDHDFAQRLHGFAGASAGEVTVVLDRARALAAQQPAETELVALASAVDDVERACMAGTAAGPARMPA